MPSRYRVNGEHGYKFGTLIKLEPDKLTIKLDSGKVITAPPHNPQYVGIISERQLKRIQGSKKVKGY